MRNKLLSKMLPRPLAYDFSQGNQLIKAGLESARAFLSELSVRGPGVYGNPHLHDDPMHTSVEVGSSVPLPEFFN